jgi:alpha 1,3-glucosidase
MNKIPVYQRGGSIIPRKLRIRRSSALGVHDPFTLTAALDAHEHAAGRLYVDDYHTLEHTKGAFLLLNFEVKRDGSALVFACTRDAASGPHTSQEWIEKIEIVGLATQPRSVVRSDGGVLSFEYDHNTKVLEIKKPADSLTPFSIRIL